MWKRTFILAVLLYLFAPYNTNSQTVYTYDFGTSVASYSLAGSSNNITSAQSGNAYIYIASSPNGGAQLKNPGLTTFGTGSKLMLHSSASGGSANKFAIWGYSGGTSSYTKFTVVLADSNGSNTPINGTFYFCTGTGASFQNNNGLSPGDILSGLKWTVASNGTIGTKTIKSGNSWRDVTLNPFQQGQTNVYTIEVFGNNGSGTISYNYNNQSTTLAPLKQDIYINGTLCADDFEVSGNGLVQGASVDCLMFYVEENSASKLCAFIDNVSYQSTISPVVQTYIDYYSKPSGNVNILSNWTSNSDGSGTGYPPNFSGGTSGTATMNFNLTNRTSAAIDANWTISGVNCRLVIGAGSSACTLAVPSAYSLTAPAITISNQGVLQVSNNVSVINSMIVNNGGTYIHNANGSAIPNSVWNTNSNCIISGITNSAPSGFGQNFYNLTWNNASQSQNINIALPSGFAVSNDLTIQNTGGVSGRTLQLIQNTSRDITVTGNLYLNGGHLALSSGSGILNMNVTGNTLLSNNSELYLSQNGSAASNFILKGNLTVNNGSVVNDNGSQPGNTIVFSKNGTQILYRSGILNNINYTVTGSTTLAVDNDIVVNAGKTFTLNGTLYFWNYILSGAGNFTLGNGATIGIGNSLGITLSGASGSIQNSGIRSFSTGANYVYNGSTAQVTGNALPGNVNNLTFENPLGITLSGSVQANGLLTLVSGIVDLNNYDIQIATSGSLSGYSSNVYFKTSGNGSIKRNVGVTNVTFPVGCNSYTPVVLNTSGAADNFSVRVQNTIDDPTLNDHLVNKQWIINRESGSVSDVATSITWNSADENPNFDRTSTVSLGRWNSSSWDIYYGGFGYSGPGPYTVSVSQLSNFGKFIIGNPGALPVDMVYFISTLTNNSVLLSWQTSFELNNSGFRVYRKSIKNGSEWMDIGFVPGKGNTNNETEYTFTDSKLETGNYNYRLKQTDHNGNFEYFSLPNTVEIGKPKISELLQNYPNPFNPVTKIDYYLSENGLVKIEIFDVTGKEVSMLVNEYKEAGFYYTEFNGSNFASGFYFYRISAGSYTAIKKMIILK
jgi:hypothetical protein